MKILFLVVALLSVKYQPAGQAPNPLLNDVVNVFYGAKVITKAIREALEDEVNAGRLNTVDSLFLRMEALSFQTLPDSVRAYFLPNTYHALPPYAHSTPGKQPVPAGYKVVVDYLHSEGILGEHCKELLDEYLLSPSYVTDLYIEDGTLNHAFIQLLTKLDECNAQ